MTTADTTAEIRLQVTTKSRGLRVSVDPSGWDRENCVLFAAEPALCRNKEGRACCYRLRGAAPQVTPRTSMRRRGTAMIQNRFFWHLTADWQGLGQLPTGVRGYERTKRGCEKFLLCLIYTGSKLFAPSNKCSYSFSWPSEEVNIFGAAPQHQRKRQPMNIVLLLSTETETTAAGHCPGGKRLKRTNITACAMRDAPLAHR